MTVKRHTRCGGLAAVIARQLLQNSSQQIDPVTISKAITHRYNTSVSFNEKDQLQLATKDDGKISEDDKSKLNRDQNDNKNSKVETIKIDDIVNCVNVETYPSCRNTLVFYVSKHTNQEAIALKFENEQDFKRIYFTYKYFKMRNRLTKNHSNYASTDNLFSKKKTYNDTLKIRKSSIDNYDKLGNTEFDLHQTTDNNGVMHISIQQKTLNSRFDQTMSLIGIRIPDELGEIDSVIYTDVDVPAKPDRKKLFQRLKPRAPPPPANKENQKILKGQFVRVNVQHVPDVVPKESKFSKIPDILSTRDKPRTRVPSNVWTTNNKGAAGYESDREEWRSRSQFSSSAYDSLARPAKTALTFTLRKPTPAPQYYRLPDPALYPRPPDGFLRPRLPRPPDAKHRFASLQSPDARKTERPTITTRISGITSRLKELGGGRLKAPEASLKPVIKKGDGGERQAVRSCSAEPPKKVTFSAYATVQVV